MNPPLNQSVTKMPRYWPAFNQPDDLESGEELIEKQTCWKKHKLAITNLMAIIITLLIVTVIILFLAYL